MSALPMAPGRQSARAPRRAAATGWDSHPASDTAVATVRPIESAPSWKGRGEASAVSPLAAIGRRVRSLVVSMTIVAAAGAIGVGAGLLSQDPPYGGETWEHSVAAGESVWGLAESIDSQRPLEDVVEDVYELNDLTSSTLYPGQTLVLPVE